MARIKTTRLTDTVKRTQASEMRQKAKNSASWFRRSIQQSLNKPIRGQKWVYDRIDRVRETSEGVKLRNKVYPGSLYFYVYDPKYKETLPYYDRFPCVMPIEPTENGFYGMNFHYLPPILRAKLLDEILRFAVTYPEKERIQMSYGLLRGVAGGIYKPTVKRYLRSHVKTMFAEIPVNDWDEVIFLPTEQFAKATKSQVWADSRRSL